MTVEAYVMDFAVFKKKLSVFTNKLIANPPTLTPNELYDAMQLIFAQLKLESDIGTPSNTSQVFYIPITAFLIALRTTGLDHKAEYIAAATKAVLSHSTLIDIDLPIPEGTVVLDIVGTGGDGQNTFNVSTSSAIVASGIPNLKICKHGGKSSTSNSGSGDMMTHLGIQDPISVNSITVPKLWESNDFLFLLAPVFHHGMKFVAELRKLIGVPTIFNVLGPLLHPVKDIHKRILGVYSQDLGEEYCKAAKLIYPDSEIFVVWGHIGLDEVSPMGKTTIWHTHVNNPKIDQFEIEPYMFGLHEHTLVECRSNGPIENAKILRNILTNKKDEFSEAIKDYILLNTAVLYCLANGTKDWKKGVEAARLSIESGSALKTLDTFIKEIQIHKEK